VDVDRVARLRARVDRARFLPLLSAGTLRRRFLPGLEEYVSYYARIYAAIARVSGSSVVIDSSKHASLAFCLSSSPAVDLRVVHVVRDSRAVAYSWGKVVRRPDSGSQTRMSMYSAPSAAARWNIQNGAVQLLSQLGPPTLRIRYEDLVGDPPATLREVAAFAELPGGAESGFLRSDGPGGWCAELRATHTASGNPMRFMTGPVQIRADNAWQDAMLPARRRTVTTLTLPLLMRYGYLSGAQ
jgi:Sulfotransferase family